MNSTQKIAAADAAVDAAYKAAVTLFIEAYTAALNE